MTYANVPPPDDPMRARSRGDVFAREAPLLLQQFLNGEVDLDRELSARYGQMPLLSLMHIHEAQGRRAASILGAQDGSAGLVVEVDLETRTAQFTFTWGAMLGLRFAPTRMSDADRAHWLEQMRRASGDAVFLWGARRWESDYLIWSARRHFTNCYAFSPAGGEAAVRLTHEVTRRLLDWLEACWPPPQSSSGSSAAW